jgi:hypothetical protein
MPLPPWRGRIFDVFLLAVDLIMRLVETEASLLEQFRSHIAPLASGTVCATPDLGWTAAGTVTATRADWAPLVETPFEIASSC